MKVKIMISGMKCNGCKDQVNEILQKFKGINTVEVNLDDKMAIVDTDKRIKETRLTKLFAKTPYNIESFEIIEE